MKLYSILEKVLWAVLILMFVFSLVFDWVKDFVGSSTSFTDVAFILTIISGAALLLERFLVGPGKGKSYTSGESFALLLVFVYMLVMMLQAKGIFTLSVLGNDQRSLWILAPALALLWFTKTIAPDIEKKDKERIEQKKKKFKNRER
ncbi:hypothetical protein [Anaerostipes sp.]|uniref:hypothetical protein n=1 Tax=Anaerostipes sp. TaxID=1872530 RepID=UPI0025C3FC20|nr:hypothetical protein [Anaerostipes sp.]MBS7007836.1 hypothetical protein [Anaerostipes sp.]